MNVLFLIVDDMNDYGFYKTYPGVKMPYLDKFKESAVTFRNAYCASPVCTPSRAATFSGMYPHQTGAYFNGSDPWRQSDVLKNIETLPECLKKSGYTTFGRGKLYHAKLEEGRDQKNWDNKPYGGGFAPFPDKEHQLKGNFWGHQAFPDSVFPDVKNSQAAINFLQKQHETPFFLALGLWRPHSPFTAPKRFFDMYDINNIKIPEGYRPNDNEDIDSLALKLIDPFKRFPVSGAKTEAQWKEMIWAYLACNSFADWSVGRVIEELDNSPYADNTIVVFWSDNGYHCGEKDHWEKGTIWEQASLTPMAIRVPGSSNGGKSCTKPVSLVDLYPTLVDYCNIQKPTQNLPGQSLRPLLEKTDKKWKKPALTTLGEEYSSVRNEQYRYIKYKDGSEELYDHQIDPKEFTNLANKKKYSKLKKRMAKSIPSQWAKELLGRRH